MAGVWFDMKSTVKKLYDHQQSTIPQELLVWRISDDEMKQHLDVLSHNHAFEADVDIVQVGDSVACKVESECPHWNRPVMLFYPGRELLAPELENACVGAGIGESRVINMEGQPVKLTVTRIVRRSNMPVGDELARAEGIEGVETLRDYCDWYRQTNEPTRKLHASYRVASFLLDEIAKKSDLFIDQEEKNAWINDRVDKVYDALVDAGADPTIPKEGFDFLTVEQAKANMFRQFEPFFAEYVAQVYMVETKTGCSIEQIVQEKLEAMCEADGYSAEEVYEKSGKAMVYGKFAFETALELLAEYTKEFLEA